MWFRVFAIFAFLSLSACTTPGGLSVGAVDRPLADLQHLAAKSLPLGLRKTSPNGREFFSNYFITNGRKFKLADKGPERRYAQILVLGDRRPYTLDVVVQIEKVDANAPGGYSIVGTDVGIAKVVKKRLQSQLNKRREDLNIIDDFRVF